MLSISSAMAVAALGASQLEIGQVLALHRATGVEQPEQLTVAAGDRRLLAIHRAVTGEDLEICARCNACGEVSAALLSPQAVPPEAQPPPAAQVRPPTYGDLLELPAEPAAAEHELLRRCTIGVSPRPAGAAEFELVDDSLAGPIVVACAACGGRLEMAADIERLVLERLHCHAVAIDREIHLLAAGYGWSLAAIEALPDDRRRRFAWLLAEER